MQTVQAWSGNSRYEYEFIDDALFDHVPQHIRDCPISSLLPFTDIARLGVLRERLASTYERAIWFDADIVIFRPDRLRIPDGCGAMLSHEIWTSIDNNGHLSHRRGINNAALVFKRDHPLLDFLHHASIELFEHRYPARLRSTTLGPDFLTPLGHIVPLRLLTQVACLSPLLMHALFSGENPAVLHAHAEQYGYEFHAANLCRSAWAPFRTLETNHSFALHESQILEIVETLIATRGTALILNSGGSNH